MMRLQIKVLAYTCIYSQTCLISGHSKIDKMKVLKTGGSLMQV